MPKAITYNSTYHNNLILVYPDQKLGCQKDILQSLEKLFVHMTNKHSKVLFIRFDVRYPFNYQLQETQTNKLFSRFMAALVLYYQRQGYDPHYLWVRDGSDGAHPHYHVVFMLNGHKAKYYMPVLKNAEQLWGYQLKQNAKGLIFYCNRDWNGNPQDNGICIRRDRAGYRETYNRCFRWGSSLAKASSKECTPYYTRQYGLSRLT